MRTVACFCVVLVVVNASKGQGWRGIVPLHSTRADVERLIGFPMVPDGITYDLKRERVNVVYSHGGCKRQAEWNVPHGTVIGITIYPQTSVMISDLGRDLSRFERFINPHNPELVYYNNKEEGFSIGAKTNGEVSVFEYYPAVRDTHLRCPNSSRHRLSLAEMKYFIFDEYFNLSFSDERARLDNFRIYLQREPDTKGYIVVYKSRRMGSGEAKRRANRAKSYLVSERGLDAKRVVAMEGGQSEKAKVELYALPPEVSGPPNSSELQRRQNPRD